MFMSINSFGPNYVADAVLLSLCVTHNIFTERPTHIMSSEHCPSHANDPYTLMMRLIAFYCDIFDKLHKYPTTILLVVMQIV